MSGGKPFPALCIGCKHSEQERGDRGREYFIECTHPAVNAKNPWALGAGSKSAGRSSCTEERKKTSFFAACGMKGKLWEPKT